MKNEKSNLLLLIIITIVATLTSCKREDVAMYAPIESFPEDTILENIISRKAMIVIAHDDDMCAMSGTISMLNKKGWEIRVLSLPKRKSRNEAHQKACKNILDSVLFFGFKEEGHRLDTENVNLIPLNREEFKNIFNKTLVESEIIEQVNEFQPSVIFTLDNLIGAYGHAEHIFISQLVLDLAKVNSISPKYIYQSVYTDHMETTIMNRHSKRMKSWGFPGDGWEKAKKTYEVEGMPEPTVQIRIVEEASPKMEYLMSYNKRERKTMGFFIPAFDEYSAEEYFKIFDREFFRVIEIY